MWEMGQRLADAGYLVLQPDLYYRFGSYPPKVPSEVLSNQASMAGLMKWVNSLDRDRKVSDSSAFIEYLASRPDVKGKRSGATGYCMGGNTSLTAAKAVANASRPPRMIGKRRAPASVNDRGRGLRRNRARPQ